MSVKFQLSSQHESSKDLLVLFSLICLSGFLLQVQQVSELYFRFVTTSITMFKILEVDHYQTMIYCPRSVDLLNKTNEVFGNTENLPLTLEQVENKLSNLCMRCPCKQIQYTTQVSTCFGI